MTNFCLVRICKKTVKMRQLGKRVNNKGVMTKEMREMEQRASDPYLVDMNEDASREINRESYKFSARSAYPNFISKQNLKPLENQRT